MSKPYCFIKICTRMYSFTDLYKKKARLSKNGYLVDLTHCYDTDEMRKIAPETYGTRHLQFRPDSPERQIPEVDCSSVQMPNAITERFLQEKMLPK